MRAGLGVSVNRETKCIHIKSVHCSSTQCYSERCSLLGSSDKLFREAIEYYATRHISVLDQIAHVFFEPGWEFTYPNNIPCVEHSEISHLKKWEKRLWWFNYSIPWHKTTAFFDPEPDIAAIKIQSAFRGWRVRMKYRYNPYNCLGQYVIMKAGGF